MKKALPEIHFPSAYFFNEYHHEIRALRQMRKMQIIVSATFFAKRWKYASKKVITSLVQIA